MKYLSTMSMTSRIVLDSSVMVRYFKQSKTELLDFLLKAEPVELCINSTVLSEGLIIGSLVKAIKHLVAHKKPNR